ncbi:hypothetical protein KSS87_021615 [Heliosperma pusillum]|nr:hypothetical protein KSS87_021615 [Heliosperma pusillum]
MGLLSIIRKIKRKEKEMRILMVGLDNSGKTTIVLKINGEDTSKTIRAYWRNYFEQTDGLIWVVDSSDLRRLDDCRNELHNLLKEERLSGASLLIFANKQDIQGALSPTEITKVLNLDALDKTRHWKIEGCSASYHYLTCFAGLLEFRHTNVVLDLGIQLPKRVGSLLSACLEQAQIDTPGSGSVILHVMGQIDGSTKINVAVDSLPNFQCLKSVSSETGSHHTSTIHFGIERSSYRTPVKGLYLCGSGAHPGGGVTGAPDRNAALTLLRDLKENRH